MPATLQPDWEMLVCAHALFDVGAPDLAAEAERIARRAVEMVQPALAAPQKADLTKTLVSQLYVVADRRIAGKRQGQPE